MSFEKPKEAGDPASFGFFHTVDPGEDTFSISTKKRTSEEILF
jgi:hypothetical protein